ncbi:putative F-box/LRR-repeat protein 23 [Hibiscus syriacus]|uniref:F-box/LRR-repeat protein 23 n=1 Tax=Hibiscus syriacus TaxID=106335 RepID=A0A6A3BP75_HIBSY|nr:F-box protein SKIP19-like [Hibiscus syriacus]XP_039068463.1 F-box protein SKIP19-like [Hibiscus syriacus]KAE8716892.1 putative F-box/LRR-repeat protein 23 [Hibiscus syriacus]
MSAAVETRNWLELPFDVTASILSRLGAVEILNSAQNVCSQWRNICKDPSMWRSIDMRNSGDLWDMDYDLEKMCIHAIDRSCGYLLDINVEYFGTDEILSYISERSVHLKRLRLVSCYNISDEGLSKAALKLPFLEELEISYCSISKYSLETIGRSCPFLKTLKFNLQGYRRFHLESDDEALAIAQTMPELCHLQLFGNKLTNEGLQAILNGCPHLEYLDLRQCFNVSLGGNLEKRCVEHIKNLRRPNDSTHDYEFNAEVHDTGSSDEDYPSGISDIDLISDDYDDYFEFSGASDLSDYDDYLLFD